MSERVERNCRHCGRVTMMSRYVRYRYQHCEPCQTAYRVRLFRLEAALATRYPRLMESGLGKRCIRPLASAYAWEGIEGVAAAHDAALLVIEDFGPRMLAVFRAACPPPPAERTWAPEPDWAEHAAMVALGS